MSWIILEIINFYVLIERMEKYHRYRLFLDWNKNNFDDSYFSFLNVYKSSVGYDIRELKKIW